MKSVPLVIAVLFLAVAAAVPSSAKEIKIGLVTPLSGDVKTFGESVRNSFLIAVEEANAKGGVAGMKITVVIQDDKNDATEAANVANLLVNQHRVKAIVGSVTSKATIPISDIIQAGRSRRSLHGNQPEGDGGRREAEGLHVPCLLHRPVPGGSAGEIRAGHAEEEERSRPVRRVERLFEGDRGGVPRRLP